MNENQSTRFTAEEEALLAAALDEPAGPPPAAPAPPQIARTGQTDAILIILVGSLFGSLYAEIRAWIAQLPPALRGLFAVVVVDADAAVAQLVDEDDLVEVQAPGSELTERIRTRPAEYAGFARHLFPSYDPKTSKRGGTGCAADGFYAIAACAERIVEVIRKKAVGLFGQVGDDGPVDRDLQVHVLTAPPSSIGNGSLEALTPLTHRALAGRPFFLQAHVALTLDQAGGSEVERRREAQSFLWLARQQLAQRGFSGPIGPLGSVETDRAYDLVSVYGGPGAVGVRSPEELARTVVRTVLARVNQSWGAGKFERQQSAFVDDVVEPSADSGLTPNLAFAGRAELVIDPARYLSGPIAAAVLRRLVQRASPDAA